MANPFTLRVIPPFFPFYNRTIELQQLCFHADNKANIVLFSPRRYGKTSLIHDFRSFVEAFFHAKYFLDMVVKYGKEIEEPPEILPSGWAAVLCLYNLR